MAGHSDNALELPRFETPVKILVVIAPYYRDIATAQIAAMRKVCETAEVTYDLIEVPGALEIPAAIGMAGRLSNYDGYVALGCVIRGATSHYDIVVNESARGLTMLGLSGHCIGNGIITVENREQALERADQTRLNTAGGATEAALHLIALGRRWSAPKAGVGFYPESYRIAGSPDDGASTT